MIQCLGVNLLSQVRVEMDLESQGQTENNQKKIVYYSISCKTENMLTMQFPHNKVFAK